MSKPRGICKISDCGKPHFGHGWCRNHWYRWHIHGDPLAGIAPQGEPMAFYLANVDRETDDCIIWPYGKHDFGYGQINLGEGRKLAVHRAACERRHGPPPTDKPEAGHLPVVCHDPACFNARHLRWVSRKQQAVDRKLDGTFHNGADHINAKLTWKQVDEIRRRYAAGGITQAQLATEYMVTLGTLSRVIRKLRYVPDA